MKWEITNNETPGMTAQKIVCDLYDLDDSQFENRIEDWLIEYMKPELIKAMNKINKKPVECTTFSEDYSHGSSRSPVNFLLSNGETLSIKTNWSTNSRRVAPPVVGQPGNETFDYHFGHLYEGKINNKKFKRLIAYQSHEVLPILLDYLFVSDYTIWLYRKKEGNTYRYEHKLIKRSNIPDYTWEKDKLSLTSSLKDWNESTTLKYQYDGNSSSYSTKLSIANFQVHKNRSGYKSRFIMDKLLQIIENKEINNETLGMTAEKVICEIFNLDISNDLKDRSNSILEGEIRPTIKEAFNYLPNAIRHTGSDSGERGGYSKAKVDFILTDSIGESKTLSLKTNWNIRNKVCPPEVGQPGDSTFIKYFGHLMNSSEINNDIFKELVINNTLEMFKIYLEHLFDCDYLLWIYYDENTKTYKYKIIDSSELSKFNWEEENFSFTRYLEKWNKSTTLKYNGTSIGEFQVHSNRNSYKFRFNFHNLLKIIS